MDNNMDTTRMNPYGPSTYGQNKREPLPPLPTEITGSQTYGPPPSLPSGMSPSSQGYPFSQPYQQTPGYSSGGYPFGQSPAIQGMGIPPVQQGMGMSPAQQGMTSATPGTGGYGSQSGITPLTPFNQPIPVTTENIMYLNAFLRTMIGRRVTVDFLLGTNTVQDRTGTLLAVGANYIVLNEVETDDLLTCDFYSIKFVRIYY